MADRSKTITPPPDRGTEIKCFKVVSRVRPFIEEEMKDLGKEGVMRSIVEMKDDITYLLDPETFAPKSQFQFDASVWSIPPNSGLRLTFADTRRDTFETQQDVYRLVGQGMVEEAFQGFNSCILTYGQTGSGKTYTMMGKYDAQATCGGDGEEGIIPRVCHDLFTKLEEVRSVEALKESTGPKATFSVEVLFVEIYMEKVRDLLDPTLRNTKEEKLNDAKIRLDPDTGPFIEGVTKYRVENWAQCCTLLQRGSLHRTTCATLVHQQSSRSHAIFQITVLKQVTFPPKDRYSLPTTRTKAGRINLVDLAGSERGGMAEYVKESSMINKSLLALRRVIDNLVERQKIMLEQTRNELEGTEQNERSVPQVPYRDSVLTWLLSDSIGGNATTTMVATLSPLAKNYNDTLATLVWSSKARNLVTFVRQNDPVTSIADGMSSKVDDLADKVRLQRQTVDTLTLSLQEEKSQAEQLEKESQIMMRNNTRAQKDAEMSKLQIAALQLQRWALKLYSKKRLEELREKLVMQRAIRDNAVELCAEQKDKLDEILEREAKLNEMLQQIRDTDALNREKLHQLEAGEEGTALLERRERARVRAGEVGAAAAAVQKSINECEGATQNTEFDIANLASETAAVEAETMKMKQVIATSTMSDAEYASVTVEANMEAAEQANQLAELRRKRDALLRARNPKKK